MENVSSVNQPSVVLNSEERLQKLEKSYHKKYVTARNTAIVIAAVAAIALVTAVLVAIFLPGTGALVAGLVIGWISSSGGLAGSLIFGNIAAYNKEKRDVYRLPLPLLPKSEKDRAVVHSTAFFESLPKRDRERYAQEQVARDIYKGYSVLEAYRNFSTKYGACDALDHFYERTILAQMLALSISCIVKKFQCEKSFEKAVEEITVLESTITEQRNSSYIGRLVKANCEEMGVVIPKELFDHLKNQPKLLEITVTWDRVFRATRNHPCASFAERFTSHAKVQELMPLKPTGAS